MRHLRRRGHRMPVLMIPVRQREKWPKYSEGLRRRSDAESETGHRAARRDP